MNTMAAFEFSFEDVEYLRHPDPALLARVYRPRGAGPFPCVIELHGGAWSQFDRTRGKSVHEALAGSGIVVVSLDFRQGPQGAYPLSVADINFGIRWVKANASSLNIDPHLVGVSGNSSGGHLAMLVAMRPRDARYSQISGPSVEGWDASVGCVVMLWPVIDPLSRYRHAKRLREAEQRPDWVDSIIKFHDDYWRTEENMAEGNPMMALERRESLVLPPALWVQSNHDEVHNYVEVGGSITMSEKFTSLYRAAGGQIKLISFDAPMMFTTAHPTLPESMAALDQVVAFVHEHLKPVAKPTVSVQGT